IIMAWNHIWNVPRAWNAYRDFCRFAKLRPEGIKNEHYETLAISFLDAKRPDRALSIAKFIHKRTGEAPEFAKDAALLYHEMVEDAHALNVFSEDMDKVIKDLVDKKYFIASWTKNLVR